MPDAKGRILVVDDAALVRMYYRQILEEAGYGVVEALNGIEGLEQLLTQPVSLMIVDVNMPHMDGLTFLKSVRVQPTAVAATPALVTSTESRPADFAAAREAGANYYLAKPVSREALLEYVGLLSGVASSAKAAS
jgi:two-component system chemotaxis response regulator CheY